MTQRDWQKDWDRATMFDDIEFLVNNPRPLLNVNNYEPPYVLLKYWLQEAKERGEREQQLKEAVEEFLPDMMPVTRALMKRKLSTLYPDTPAPKEGE
ncbi:hypothetical protein NST41_09370 [Paenibacillus sp. FSL L8-0696]|uniref:hypothetical protein n=1 Tax=Paenibacillus sp. FSL L8-0696 TaxID=2954524 RepID=UPI00311936F8